MIDPNSFLVPFILPNRIAVIFRAIRSDDKERLRAAFKKLDQSSIYRRFFGHKKDLTEAELDQATKTDFESVSALVALTTVDKVEIIIGGARYVRSSECSAEVAFTIEEDFQGLGIATQLLRHLADIARANGLQRFEADVLADNLAMLSVFRRSGFPMKMRSEAGVTHVELDLCER